jgi:hypothetical protein
MGCWLLVTIWRSRCNVGRWKYCSARLYLPRMRKPNRIASFAMVELALFLWKATISVPPKRTSNVVVSEGACTFRQGAFAITPLPANLAIRGSIVAERCRRRRCIRRGRRYTPLSSRSRRFTPTKDAGRCTYRSTTHSVRRRCHGERCSCNGLFHPPCRRIERSKHAGIRCTLFACRVFMKSILLGQIRKALVPRVALTHFAYLGARLRIEVDRHVAN